jgi:nucleoside-diphosphate-sugar epimerase
MKLIIAGASGFVGRELILQSLAQPKIKTVIALSRKPISAPSSLAEGSDASKLRNVIIKDYDQYSDEAKAEFAGADACIW